MLLVGILSALGLLLLALKAGGRKTIGHDIFVDVMITITLWVFLWHLQWYGCCYGRRFSCFYCFVYHERQ